MLQWIQEWYKSNCDGYWEHMYGVKIDTLDNPGWIVHIDLIDTPLEQKEFVLPATLVAPVFRRFSQIK